MRSLLERTLQGIVLKRQLPPRYGGGTLYASSKVGGLKYLFKPASLWDPPLLRICALIVKQGDIVWDIGANVGLFAMCASKQSGPKGKVLAVEADLDALHLLHRSFAGIRRGCAQVMILPVAVSDKAGWDYLNISSRARAANALAGFGSTSLGRIADCRPVPTCSLDGLLDDFPAPDVVKIDVEGAELRLLEAATELLQTARPRIYCEIANEHAGRIAGMLDANAYRYLPQEKFSSTRDLAALPSETGFNTVAFPIEYVERVLAAGG